MGSAIKINNESKIPIGEGHIGNNKVVLRMDEDLANFRNDTKSSMINYCEIGTVKIIRTKQKVDYLQTNIYPIDIENCKSYERKKNISESAVLKQNIFTTRNCHRVIAPKLRDMDTNKPQKNLYVDGRKMRDDKRRTTHNEIEKRRRSKINNSIYRLKGLIPEKLTANSFSELNCKTSSTDSKSQILIRTYDYIQCMQKELTSLREYIRANDQFRLGNQKFIS